MKYPATIILILISVVLSSAHGGKKHGKDSVKQESKESVTDTAHTDSHEHEHHDSIERPVRADLDDFPSIHPLIVHFAIVLIIIAALIQFVNVLFMRKEFAWVVTGLIVIGLNAAFLASTKFHPHTHGLTEQAKAVLHLHDKYADWTLYLAGFAATLQILNLFLLKTKRWAAAIVLIVMVASSYCIIHAGHYGAQLVHIEGVGPQGKFLETDHHH